MARKEEEDGEVARVAALRYWRSADAEVVVDAWKRSGEGLREFAERQGIHPGRLRRWTTQLGEAAEAVRFHPVRVVHPGGVERRVGEPLEIVVGEGCRVRVPPGFAAEDLERVLEVLDARC
jgi:hypothetical protein